MTRARRIALAAGTVVLLGAVFVLTFAGAEVFSLVRGSQASADHAAPDATASEYRPRELSPEEVQAMADRGEAFILADVRSASAFEAKHITGARSMPASTIDSWASEVKPDELLVFYCSCVDDGASLATAQFAEEQYGLTNVAILKGGLRAWQAQGLPMTVK